MIRTAYRGWLLPGLLSALLLGAAHAQQLQPPVEVEPAGAAAAEATPTPADDEPDKAAAPDGDGKSDAGDGKSDAGDGKSDAGDGTSDAGKAGDDNDAGKQHANGESGEEPHANGESGEEPHGKAAGGKEAHGKEGHGGDAGDPMDLSHSNATPAQEDILEWRFDLAFFTLVVFVLLLLILLKFAWGPIIGALEKREGRIAALIDEAESSSEKARQQLAAYEDKLAAAHQEAEAIVARASQAASEQADQIVADARAASQREKELAIAEIEVAKNEALGEVTQRSVDIALSLAKGIVSRELKAEDHDSLIQAALDKFPT